MALSFEKHKLDVSETTANREQSEITAWCETCPLSSERSGVIGGHLDRADFYRLSPLISYSWQDHNFGGARLAVQWCRSPSPLGRAEYTMVSDRRQSPCPVTKFDAKIEETRGCSGAGDMRVGRALTLDWQAIIRFS